MTPATYSLDLVASTSGMSASLTNGDNQPLFDGATPEVPTDRLTPIRTTLAQLMPGVPISQFTYRRQTLNNLLETGAYGKAMVSGVVSRHDLAGGCAVDISLSVEDISLRS